MRIWLCALIALALCMGAWAQTERAAIAVVDFENRAADGGPELGEMCAEMLSDLLIQTRQFRVFDRDRLSSVVQEQNFQSMSGLVDMDEAVRLGRMIGVRYLVSGAVLRTGVETNEFSGYGVTTRTDNWQTRVRVQVIDVETGESVFSQTGEASRVIQGTAQHGGTFSSMIFEQLLEDAMPPLADELEQDLRARAREDAVAAAPPEPSAPTVAELRVDSNPEGADIEIDGLFVGNTPAQIEVEPGVRTVRVSLAGHTPWQRDMQIVPGARINATLEPIATAAVPAAPAPAHVTPAAVISQTEPPATIMSVARQGGSALRSGDGESELEMEPVEAAVPSVTTLPPSEGIPGGKVDNDSVDINSVDDLK